MKIAEGGFQGYQSSLGDLKVTLFAVVAGFLTRRSEKLVFCLGHFARCAIERFLFYQAFSILRSPSGNTGCLPCPVLVSPRDPVWKDVACGKLFMSSVEDALAASGANPNPIEHTHIVSPPITLGNVITPPESPGVGVVSLRAMPFVLAADKSLTESLDKLWRSNCRFENHLGVGSASALMELERLAEEDLSLQGCEASAFIWPVPVRPVNVALAAQGICDFINDAAKTAGITTEQV